MRRLRFLLAVLSAAVLAGVLRATDFVWPGHGTIHFDVPDSWRMVGKQAEEAGYAFRARPNSPTAALLLVTVAELPPDKALDPSNLNGLLGNFVREILPTSVEKEFSPQPLPLAQGGGVYAQLTDASLVGRPPQRDNFKIMRSGVAALDLRTLAVFTIQFDDLNSPAVGDMMAMVRSLTFSREAQRDALTANNQSGRFEFTVPESKLRLLIPAGQLVPDTDRIGGGTNHPRYFKLGDGTGSLILSGWFEPGARYDGVKKFWRKEAAALTGNGFKPEGVEFASIGPWEVIYYHQTLAANARMCHVRAELARAGTWIDLHFSATGPEPLAELRQRLTSLLSSIEIIEK